MVARRGIEAPSRRHPWFTPDDLLRWKHRECRPMATVNLTARYLDLLKPQRKRYEVFDTIVPGFAIRVTPAGHKSFTLYYRHHGRIRRVGLGRYPDILLADARKAATQHRGRIFDGADPAEEKKSERATNPTAAARGTQRCAQAGSRKRIAAVGYGRLHSRRVQDWTAPRTGSLIDSAKCTPTPRSLETEQSNGAALAEG